MSTTYVVRVNNEQGFETRTSKTMAYTHAVVWSDESGEGAYSWHTSRELASKASSAIAHISTTVREVEAHEGGKAKVVRALTTLIFDSQDEVAKPEPKATPGKAAKAGSRAIPTDAANKVRATYLAEVGMDKYRSQYNGGWDSATAGQGSKKAASGTASVAWMDGFLDRTANPGKAGIASKWAALRSKKNPVMEVAAK